jgi:hypothetical protein
VIRSLPEVSPDRPKGFKRAARLAICVRPASTADPVLTTYGLRTGRNISFAAPRPSRHHPFSLAWQARAARCLECDADASPLFARLRPLRRRGLLAANDGSVLGGNLLAVESTVRAATVSARVGLGALERRPSKND